VAGRYRPSSRRRCGGSHFRGSSRTSSGGRGGRRRRALKSGVQLAERLLEVGQGVGFDVQFVFGH
jgi:hypothetical protein